MCDYYFQRMDEDHGDLADVVRAGGRSTGLLSNADVVKPLLGDDPASWQQQLNRDFGDPFTYVSDPLLNPFAAYAGIGGGDGRDQQQLLAPPPEKASCIIGGTSLLPQLHTISPPPSSSRLLMRPTPAVASGEMMVKVAASAAAACSGGVQISPHGASPGIKRRLTGNKIPREEGGVHTGGTGGSDREQQAERRRGGSIRSLGVEEVRAETNQGFSLSKINLHAWNKLSRGYYRCSSSKGCSARKQVERSRTEPNMLVITYTSEHNHPWPTQRNALAGSIRSHLSKSSSQRPPSTAGPTIPDIEQWPMSPGLVKEEATDDDQFDYKPMVPEPDQPDDFFSDLAELESDPMNLIFSKGFGEDDKQKEEEEEVMAAKAAADPLFDMFDWDTGSS
ncbi:hypothetical protein ZIOFF_045515 [Zingiber officinale]|uniref:WRKY domain-containing protein n=1 Tax=Zingiber officinale TaxID=94328 RepID=A0A8J5G146_ZINOF|nr:hypothetical protein ZIOFF_045515 [Zingiber officinale]